MFLNETKPDLQDVLAHHGIKGQKWGVRKGDHPGASHKTNREARKDAQEFARAKLFYGEGAGTRRKLIKAKVEQKKKQDPTYSKAFDHHLQNQNMADHASKARGERRRKDVRAKTGKTARGVNRAINGPFAASLTTIAFVSAVGAMQRSGMDRKVMSAGQTFLKNNFNI